MSQVLWRRLTAEFLGTCLLVATVVGSGIMAQSLTKDIALALLANSVATGAILVVLITILGPVSGAHFNPAVTLVFAIRRELLPTQAVLYVVSQLVGGVLGTIAAHVMFAMPALGSAEKVRTGPGQWFAEAVATFGLILIIQGGIRHQRPAVPWLVGLYITAAYWFTASTSFANPAVTLARSLTDTFSGIAPASVPAFILGQVLGAIAGLGVATTLFAEPDA
jgi:glycerol uptake facilitator-like aquaporin